MKFKLTAEVETEKFTGTAFQDVHQRDIKDSLGYGRRAWGINTAAGFFILEPGDYVVTLPDGYRTVVPGKTFEAHFKQVKEKGGK